jgi:hypothetical protein
MTTIIAAVTPTWMISNTSRQSCKKPLTASIWSYSIALPWEHRAAMRLEGWRPALLLPILRDTVIRTAPQDEDYGFSGRF